MSIPQIKITNVATGEDIQRDMTTDEIAEYKEQAAEYKKSQLVAQAEAEAKAQAKATAEGKLAALGLTTDDLRALGL